MRLDISYRTKFAFDAPVRESQNELRACPVSDERQQLLSYRVTVEPSARMLSFTDYWGTRVDHFGVTESHADLEVTAEASVETQDPQAHSASPAMESLGDPAFLNEHDEYLKPTRHTDWNQAMAHQAREMATADGSNVVKAVSALSEFVGGRLAYVPGATEIGEPITEVLAKGAGVCQDYAHLGVALCRSIGIPARYASGYLFSSNERTGSIDGDLVRVQTHAWFEAAVPGVGWLALDPTNRLAVGRQHVKIGHGRDYDDVPPLRGVYSGPGTPELDASVEIRRMNPSRQSTSLMRPSLLTAVKSPRTRKQQQQQ
ncbi:transglutaminase family protein [Candidatus Poriferisocius sp.]|uniref:transglutaminase family protein n=1 Tax=Candidatus Poriferisocius sp. TaxID=3101276 RepID=UPI003B52C167